MKAIRPVSYTHLQEFVDDLSNWYVRRSRERFWAKGMEQDKINAFMTLYTALVTVAKAAAPMIPFMTEQIYQNIVRKVDEMCIRDRYIDAGADLVIGSHPHVLQGLEYYKGRPIVYSLGNFVFGSSIPKTALLTVEWDGEDALLRLVPGTSSGGYTLSLIHI